MVKWFGPFALWKAVDDVCIDSLCLPVSVSFCKATRYISHYKLAEQEDDVLASQDRLGP